MMVTGLMITGGKLARLLQTLDLPTRVILEFLVGGEKLVALVNKAKQLLLPVLATVVLTAQTWSCLSFIHLFIHFTIFKYLKLPPFITPTHTLLHDGLI